MDSVHPNSEQEAGPEGIPDGSVSDGTGIPVSSDLQTFQNDSKSSGIPSDLDDPYNPDDGFRYQDVRVRRRKQKSAGKSQKTPVTESDPITVETQGPIPKPLFKSQIPKVSKIFLWNSRGKKMQFPKDVTPPKTMVIDKVTIYIQMLTSDKAKSLGVKGWDAVLAEIKGFKPEVTECKIANFWANWWHNRLMTQKFKNQPKTPQDPTAEAAGSDPTKTPQDPTAAAAGSNTTNGNDTPSVEASKRKRTDMPSSAELAE